MNRINNETQRNKSIDLIKTFAIVGVVMIHTCSAGYYSETLSFDWISTLVIRSLVSASVPLFFMASGALLLSPKKNISIKCLYTKYLPRILVSLFLWAFLYKIFNSILAGGISYSGIIHSLKETLLFNHEYHLYFLHIVIIVYLWLPVTRLFIKYASKKELYYAMLIWFVFGILYPTIKILWPFTLINGIPNQWVINMTYASIGYSVVGFYINEYTISRRLSLAFSLLGFLAVFSATLIMSLQTKTFYTHFLSGMSVGVAFFAFGIFGLLRLKSSIPNYPIFEKLSKASFTIYLTHVFFISLFKWMNLSIFSPYIISIPLFSFVTIILSFGVYYLLRKITILKEWMFIIASNKKSADPS